MPVLLPLSKDRMVFRNLTVVVLFKFRNSRLETACGILDTAILG